VNAGFLRRLTKVSFDFPDTSQLPIENITIGGSDAIPLKNENGAKFHCASPGKELSVKAHAIGLGIILWVNNAYV
jgi:hypothetical protein